MMKKITLLMMMLVASVGFAQTIPVDFESDITVGAKAGSVITPADANWFSDSGLTSVEVLDDPTATGHGKVGVINSSSGGAAWQNAQLQLITNYIDLTGTDKKISIKIYTASGQDFLLKIEQALGGGPNLEVPFSTTGGVWETKEIDFAGVGANDQYKLIVIFPTYSTDFLDPAFDSTSYVDDISGAVGDAVAPAPVGPVTLTVSNPGAAGMRMTGPWWGWNPVGGPVAVNNGDGTFSVEMFSGGADQEEFQYLWVETTADGSATANDGQENLVDNAGGGECTDRIDAGNLITDYASWANRVFTVGPTSLLETYDDCAEAILAVEKNEIQDLTVYPNPSENKWIISTFSERIKSVEVYDLLGKRVISLDADELRVEINAESLAKGMYVAKISSDNGVSTRKLVKK